MTEWCLAHPWMTFVLAWCVVCAPVEIARAFARRGRNRA